MSTETLKKKAEEMAYGETEYVVLPSGYNVTIREQNGADDDILSNQSLSKDLSNLNLFIAGLVVKTNLPFAKGERLDSKTVLKMSLRDKYYLIFRSRIFNIGNEISWEYDWGKDNGGKANYKEDLNNYIWDFAKEFPEPESSEYKETLVEPHLKDPYIPLEFTLRSGKKLRCTALNGESEQYLLKLRMDQQTRNTELKARFLEIDIDGNWMKVENFSMFSKREMVELHQIVTLVDPNVDVSTELVNPKDETINIQFPIIGAPDFFFPGEI